MKYKKMVSYIGVNAILVFLIPIILGGIDGYGSSLGNNINDILFLFSGIFSGFLLLVSSNDFITSYGFLILGSLIHLVFISLLLGTLFVKDKIKVGYIFSVVVLLINLYLGSYLNAIVFT